MTLFTGSGTFKGSINPNVTPTNSIEGQSGPKAITELPPAHQTILRDAVTQSDSSYVYGSRYVQTIPDDNYVSTDTKWPIETSCFFPVRLSSLNEAGMEKASLRSRMNAYKTQLARSKETWPGMEDALNSLDMLCDTLHNLLVSRRKLGFLWSMRVASGNGRIWVRTQIPRTAEWHDNGFTAMFEVYDRQLAQKRWKDEESVRKEI